MAAIFLSHSSRNDNVASVLERWLRANGFGDLFVDHESIRAGDKWAEELRRAKASCRVVLFLVSREWLESDECYAEFKAAWYMGRRLIPLFWLDKEGLSERQRSRLERVQGEDQGIAVPFTASEGDLELSAQPRLAEALQTGLRAAGALVQVGLDPLAFAIDRAAVPEPFPGLDSFGDTDADAAVFFGRGQEIAQCLEDLREMRATGDRRAYAIQGASGSGKSSLLRAGILPRLRRERGWLGLRTFRPGADPLYNFADALARTLSAAGSSAAPGTLRDKLFAAWKRGGDLRKCLDDIVAPLKERWGRGNATILISMDQAEELARAPGESADALGACFKAALVGDLEERPLDYLVALTVRSDSFHELQASSRAEGIRVRTTDVRTLASFRFDTAIEEPAKRYGVEISPSLVDQVIHDSSGADTLPLLAFAMQRLWRQYAQNGRIGKEDYESLGKLHGIIADAAERALLGIDPAQAKGPLEGKVSSERERHAARVFVPALAQVNDHGAAIRRVAKLAAFNQDDLALIESFAKWRLIVISSDTAEVAHEAMFREWPRFHTWLEPERSRLSALRGLESATANWETKGRHLDDLLHRGRRLAEARALALNREYKLELDRNPQTYAYLDACRSAEQRRRVVAISAIAASLVVGVAVIFGAIYGPEMMDRRTVDQWAKAAAGYRPPPDQVLQSVQAASQLRDGAAFRDCGECPEMVVVPGGSFWMGSPDSDRYGSAADRPQHPVTVPRFAAGKFTVTHEEWAACAAGGGCKSNPKPDDAGRGRGRRPVTNVSWDDAQEYLRWLSQRTGARYRLLTESEWEYAARAEQNGTRDTKRFYTGDTINYLQANFNEKRRTTEPVGTYPPNPFGLHDMAGNAWQWVEDCSHHDYKGAPNDGSAWLDGGDCSRRIIRGGSAYQESTEVRSAKRNTFAQGERGGTNTTFRVARDLAPK
jgi:formylglycine-generating enzyme required for sulfatase activity